ncbi:MAG: hypothetical protein HKO04_03325 [Silicimonas sp.]|nr:hypothetical protein [Silicimonas sp.]
MSDSASKSDVEDVLSSVRRLVSSDAPRKRRADLPKGPGALVLTDAQRVERPVSRGQAARSLEDRIAELEVAISSRDDDYEPDGSEDQAQHTPDRIVYTRPPSGAEQAEAQKTALRLSRLSVVAPEAEPSSDEAQSDASGETGSPAVAFRHTTPGSDQDGDTNPEDEAPMAEDVSAPPRDSAEVRPFHNPDDMIDRFEARMDGNNAPRPGPGHNGFSERLEPYTPEAADDAEARADTLDEAKPDETVERSTDAEDADAADVEEDVMDAEFEADLTEAVTQSVAAEVAPQPAEPHAEDKAAEEQPTPEADAVEVAPLTPEEELLRPIVAKLIREELQGELGERITRNVRKLVRREILRAINAREFE